jgi:hypothetical protein
MMLARGKSLSAAPNYCRPEHVLRWLADDVITSKGDHPTHRLRRAMSQT